MAGSVGASPRAKSRKPKRRVDGGRWSERSDWNRRSERLLLPPAQLQPDEERGAVIGFRPQATRTVAAAAALKGSSSSGDTTAARSDPREPANNGFSSQEPGAHDAAEDNARRTEPAARLPHESPFHTPLEQLLSLNGAVVTLYPKCVCTAPHIPRATRSASC